MRVSPRGLAVCGCLCLTALVSCGKPEETGRKVASEAPVRAVQVSAAKTQSMTRTIAVTGTLAAQERSVISAKVPGRLMELRVDLGSPVKQGELLAQIERRDYELRLQQAEATLAQARTALGLPPEGEKDDVEDLARVTAVRQAQAVLEEATKNLERIQNLSRSGIASQSELDTVQATYTVAVARHETAREEARTRMAALAQRRAELNLARQQLTDTSLTAPFTGAVQARVANLGEYLVVGAPVLELVKTDPLRLRLEVPERYSHLMRLDQRVSVATEGDTNTYSGRIARLSPALVESTRMLVVEADVPAQGSLRPGNFARAEIVVTEGEPGLSVPANAISTFAGVEKVVVVHEGKALEKTVTLGRQGPGWVEVVSGLTLGEAVVLNPAGLRTGNHLVVSAEPETEARQAQAAGIPTNSEVR
ncbi:MAG TPA: efflux RND transporter periplasmic adaptor subunit [Clostridia bacterium]|nr:efflux RND transporter periplasmic adaptor subunit [Clostridia bacterium]